MWGAAVAIAEGQLQGRSQDPVVVGALGGQLRTSSRHILSFGGFDAAFDFQVAVLERVAAVTEVLMTNVRDKELLSLGVDTSTFGPNVVVVPAPASASAELTELAVAHGGTYEGRAEA